MIDDEWCRLRGLNRFKTEREWNGDLCEMERGGRHGERWYLVANWPFGFTPWYEDYDLCDVCDGKRQNSARRFGLRFPWNHIWQDHPFYENAPAWWYVEVCWSCFNKHRHHSAKLYEIDDTAKLIRKAQRELANERKTRKDQNNWSATGISR